MLNQAFRRFALVALCGALSMTTVRADDEDKPDSKSEKKETVTAKKTIAIRVATGKHWIGVMPVPIDDALKAQLNLKDRIMVHHVLPDTPAGKAGVQVHDILLKYGDKEIATADDLMSAIAASDDKESQLTVLRGGKEVTVTIKPGERPAEDKLQAILPKHKAEDLSRWLGPVLKDDQDNTFTWRVMGPGVWSKMVQPHTEFPDGLSITVSKESDKPAQITAKKDNKTYETTADKLDILPNEIRGPVERLLRGPHFVTWGAGADAKGIEGGLRYRLNAEQLEQLHKAGDIAKKKIEEKLREADGDAAKSLRQHIEVRKIEGGAVSELRKEVEALRKAVEELKGTKEKKSDQESKDE